MNQSCINKRNTMRIYITERCNANCANCFNSKFRSDSDMSVRNFERLSEYLCSSNIEKIKIMGGEPTFHENFEEIVTIAQTYFTHVGIFTNGLVDKFKNLELRDTDSIIYNFRFAEKFSTELFHLEKKGTRLLEVQVTKESVVEDLITKLEKFLKLDENRIHFNITLDCTSNIFLEKDVLVPKLLDLQNYFSKHNQTLTFDHKLPLCFLYGTGIHVNNYGMCKIFSSGVIDANLNLRFCLQNSRELMPILYNDSFIPWKLIENKLEREYLNLRISALDKICSSCVFYSEKCNGGCWISKDFISKEDIIKNTNFPIR